MDRAKLLELWNDMWKEGNWVPSWPDSLSDLSAEQAARVPTDGCHSVWQEVVHVIYWRGVTLDIIAGKPERPDDESDRLEFAEPAQATEGAWEATKQALKQTHDDIAAAISDESRDLSRVVYHLIHDAYHLGRVTQIRAMHGTEPVF